MTATASTTSMSDTPRRSFARVVTDGLDPKNWVIAVCLLGGWATAGVTGLAWGTVGTVFCAIIPLLFVRSGIRRGHYTDRHLHPRHHRLPAMAVLLTSIVTGITLMAWFDAPRGVLALTTAMLATMAALAAITTVWKISVHTAVTSGAVLLFTAAAGPGVLAALPLIGLVGWSRVALRDHTIAQVLAGGALGALTATTTYLAITP